MSSRKDAFSQGQRTEPPRLGKRTAYGLNSDNTEKKWPSSQEDGKLGWDAGTREQKGGGRRRTSASAPGCGFILLNLQAGLKEAGNSSGLVPAQRQSLSGTAGGWRGGGWGTQGRELISAYRPENNWQLHMPFRNKNEKSTHALFNQGSLAETAPKFLGRNSVDRKASPVITKLGCVEGRRDI